MKRVLASLILFIAVQPQFVFAQDSDAVIKGTVYNQQGEAVTNASVAVYTDSTQSDILTGTTSDTTGAFVIEVEPGNYVLGVSFISYATHTEPIDLNSGETENVGEITLTPTSEQMGEVTVRAEESHMEMSFDKRVFQVGQDITNMGGSAISVLDNVPSITTDIDGNISLRGNQSVRVLINGKPSSMVSDDVSAMRSIPASMIKEVEIITNPSSRFAAEGSAGIINIILKKERRQGLNGSVSAGSGIPQDHELSTNLNYRAGDINWFFGGSIDYREDPESGSSFQRFAGPDTTYMYRERTDSDESEIDGNIRVGADFYLSETEILTASAYINSEKETNREDVTYTDMQYTPGALNGDILDQVLRNSTAKESERDLDFNLDYENRIDGDEHKLVAEASFDISRESQSNDIEESVQQGTEDPLFQRTDDGEEEMDLRFDAEYVRPLGENGKLEAGLRSDTEWMDNSYRVEERINGDWQPLPSYNDNFLYLESVNAAYLTLGTEIGPLSGQIGVRAENTRIRTEIKSIGDVNDQNYLNLFPSVFLNYSFNEQQSVQVSYSRRLQRPWSRMLLPFVDFSDSRSQFTGNPNLTPEFSNSYEAGYLQYWETGSILTSFYYRYRTDVIERITQQQQGVIRIFPINLSSEEAWGIEISADQEIADALSIEGNANLFRSDSDGTYRNQTFSSSAQVFQARMRLRWEISDALNYQASMRYEGPRETTQGSRAGNTMMDMGVAHELFGGKATVSFNVRDLFDAQNFNNTVTTDGNPNTNFYSQRRFSWSSRSFTLNFTYHFNRQDGGRNERGGDWGDEY